MRELDADLGPMSVSEVDNPLERLNLRFRPKSLKAYLLDLSRVGRITTAYGVFWRDTTFWSDCGSFDADSPGSSCRKALVESST